MPNLICESVTVEIVCKQLDMLNLGLLNLW